MKRIITQLPLPLTFVILALGFQSCDEKPEEQNQTEVSPKTDLTKNQLNMSTKEIYNVELEYNFKDYVIIDLTYGSDTTLYWIERKSKSDANEEISTIHLNDHTIMAGWNESDGTKVSLYSDFERGQTYGYQFFSDGRIRKLIGTIKIKSK